MATYLFGWMLFVSGVIPAFMAGRQAGMMGIVVGSGVGVFLGLCYAVGILRAARWAVTCTSRKHLSERTWLVIDIALLLVGVPALVGLGIMAHILAKFAISAVGAM